MAQLHSFTNIDALKVQENNKSFGPDLNLPAKQFRVTSLFSGTNNDSSPRAYAVVKGAVLIQKSDNGECNLILKPDKQPDIKFSSVKYYIYRGLKYKNFFQDDDKLVSKTNANNELITEIYEEWERYNDQTSVDGLCSNIIGFDLNNLPDSTYIDDIFDNPENSPLLPLIKPGTYLGEFNEKIDFGFEIMLNEYGFNPTLKEARGDSNVIHADNSTQTGVAEPINIRYQREQILYYIDPAAYYGLLLDFGVHLHRGKSKKTDKSNKENNEELYENFIAKFHTRSTVYIDIRNEHGNSLNYYDNYRNNEITEFAKFMLGENESPVMMEKKYEWNRWPIYKGVFDTIESRIKLTFQFPHKDNLWPVIFIPQALFYEDTEHRYVFRKPPRDDNNWELTKPIAISLPTISQITSKMVGAFHCRINLCRDIHSMLIRNAPFSTAEMPQITHTIPQYTFWDTLFSPFSIKAWWKKDSDPLNGVQSTPPYQIHWKVIPNYRYNGWVLDDIFCYSVGLGVANDGIGEVAFALNNKAEHIDFSKPEKHFSIIENKLINSEFTAENISGKRKTFYENIFEIVERMMDIPYFPITSEYYKFVGKMELKEHVFNINNQEQSIYEIASSYEKMSNEKIDTFYSFAYTYTEKENLITLISDEFDQYIPAYFIILNEDFISHGNYSEYYTIKLGICGIKNNVVKRIDTGLYLYSIDNFHFCSLNYHNEIKQYLDNL